MNIIGKYREQSTETKIKLLIVRMVFRFLWDVAVIATVLKVWGWP